MSDHRHMDDACDVTSDPRDTPSPSANADEEAIASVFHSHETSTQVELAHYQHQSLFLPPTVAVLNAVKNQQVGSFSCLTDALLKHLPPATATAKGYMHQTRSNVQSTRSNMQDIKDA